MVLLAENLTVYRLKRRILLNLLAIHKLTCKIIYGSLVDHQNFSPPTAIYCRMWIWNWVEHGESVDVLLLAPL